MSLQALVILLILVFTTTLAQLFYKKGALDLKDFDFSFSNAPSLISHTFQNIWLLGSILLFLISFFLYLFVLTRLQLNIAYPILVSAGIVLIAVASWFFFRESLSLSQILGIVAIIFGIFLLLKY